MFGKISSTIGFGARLGGGATSVVQSPTTARSDQSSACIYLLVYPLAVALQTEDFSTVASFWMVESDWSSLEPS